MYLYVLPPIDWWKGCLQVGEWLAKLKGDGFDDTESIVDDIVSKMSAVSQWEGDIKDGIYVFHLPGVGVMEYGIAWKQYNNGATFVLSPQHLPWLYKDNDASEYVAVRKREKQ